MIQAWYLACVLLYVTPTKSEYIFFLRRADLVMRDREVDEVVVEVAAVRGEVGDDGCGCEWLAFCCLLCSLNAAAGEHCRFVVSIV